MQDHITGLSPIVVRQRSTFEIQTTSNQDITTYNAADEDESSLSRFGYVQNLNK